MIPLFDMEDKIELIFHKKEGNEFERFIVSLYKIKYPRFKAVKPQGNKGDGANDGYISEELIIQIYAPERINAKKAIKKLEHDFKRAIDEGWEFKIYHFVINDKFKGGLTDIHKKIDKLNKEYKDIDLELIDSETLKNMIYDLYKDNQLKIYVLLNMDKNLSEFGDFELVSSVVDFISHTNEVREGKMTDFINFSTEKFLPDGIKKLEINIQDEMFSKIFGSYIEKSNEIMEDFIPKIGLEEFEKTSEIIKDKYKQFSNKFNPEESLIKLHEFLYKKMSNDKNLETALWVVIAYFFDICDIGKIDDNGK